MSNDRLICALCGIESRDLHVSLIRWKAQSVTYTAEPRCKDVIACRARCEAAGEDWPVSDGTPATARQILAVYYRGRVIR